MLKTAEIRQSVFCDQVYEGAPLLISPRRAGGNYLQERQRLVGGFFGKNYLLLIYYQAVT